MGDYSELKKLAKAATPGPWTAVDYRSYAGDQPHWYLDTSAGKADIADSQDGTIDPNHWDDERGERDMKFIAAANPTVVLELVAELGKIDADRKACWAEFKIQGRSIDQLKSENDELVTALNEILRVTPLGAEAFGIAALVLGELGVSKEPSHD